MDLGKPSVEGDFELTTTLVDEHQTTLSLEGSLPGFGKTWATFTLLVGTESRVAGTLTGNGRTLDDDGGMLASAVAGLWSREKDVLLLTTLDQVNNGQQAFVQHEINLHSKKASVKVYFLD